MYVRDAKNRDEAWLLDHIDSMGLDETAFRSRDYVIAMNERENERAGFGRVRVHKTEQTEHCELTSIGVRSEWRGQGVGAHVVERLVTTANDQGFDIVYALSGATEYLSQFGFEPVEPAQLPDVLQRRLSKKQESLDPEAVPLCIQTGQFYMPGRLRDAFKRASADDEEQEPEEGPEDFGIDPDETTYKYDTGR
ncbi:N-acetylglutamate synthase, GNAT family [Halovenus aranensis]|jgi:N-acetylglutamate synthase-like GNAT family acetyltransferase|uniref:N-acetylglutamate synthase, GNAT family n=1 Tax=Halovenus aranensis TaxID=890420 RepID=A0A1G8W7A4_9EURY|nr:GNAT family N-acetyltransferase [Halovenus aranensis]SDJ74214.1 N-acetylglutamate synthase, GNAT family [Halovenus aranensis]